MILLDANVIIWWMAGDKRLGSNAKTLLAATETELAISLLTIFEIELKLRINKLSLQVPISDFLNKFGLEVFSPSTDELRSMMRVQLNHSDPFDCALIGLAKLKNWAIMTSDDALLKVSSNLVSVINSKL